MDCYECTLNGDLSFVTPPIEIISGKKVFREFNRSSSNVDDDKKERRKKIERKKERKAARDIPA